MNKYLLLFSIGLLGVSFSLSGQSLQAGFMDYEWIDEQRNNRPIPTKIFYPSDIGGADAPIAPGMFPVFIFGHGFLMDVTAYNYLGDTLAKKGYILVFPRTEGGFLPSHDAFAQDLVFLNKSFYQGNNQAGHPFENHILDRIAIGGHSMGGGSALLACANNNLIRSCAVFAPAETRPSAIEAASLSKTTLLIFTGEGDEVTPSDEHGLLMMEQAAPLCKYYIEIKGGGHCYFAEPNFNCDTGERISGSNISIEREAQQQVMLDYLIPWLDFNLNGEHIAWSEAQNRIDLALDDRIDGFGECLRTSTVEEKDISLFVFEVDAAGAPIEFRVNEFPAQGSFQIFNAQGQLFDSRVISQHTTLIHSHLWPSGFYLFVGNVNGEKEIRKFFKKI